LWGRGQAARDYRIKSNFDEFGATIIIKVISN
jgi:hypothetical protein